MTNGAHPTPADHELIDAAIRLIDRTTSSANHTVAAAIRTTDGTIITGINLYHFTGGPCAELVALANLAATDLAPSTIVAVGNEGRGVLSPCGRCRQILVDYWPEIRVIVPASDGHHVVPIEDLLPFSYRRADWDD